MLLSESLELNEGAISKARQITNMRILLDSLILVWIITTNNQMQVPSDLYEGRQKALRTAADKHRRDGNKREAKACERKEDELAAECKALSAAHAKTMQLLETIKGSFFAELPVVRFH